MNAHKESALNRENIVPDFARSRKATVLQKTCHEHVTHSGDEITSSRCEVPVSTTHFIIPHIFVQASPP